MKIVIIPTIAGIDVSIEWCQQNVMMRLVIAGVYVKIENFKNINMPAFIQNLLQEKDGASLQDKKYTEENSLCNILARYSLLTVKKERPE